ncbi:MerR family transcriptional regulator [Marinomonas agarivorans]|nr:MerR family transcriptional regulator [Marinomonas agarivorans]
MLSTAEVVKQSGLPASTLRFYEEKGLIHSIGRRGLQRLFPANIVEQLAFISLARMAKFSLEDIAAMFSANGHYQINKQLLHEKATLLDKEINQMIAIRDGLRHASVCPAQNHSQCPTFQKLLRVAAKKHKNSKR